MNGKSKTMDDYNFLQLMKDRLKFYKNKIEDYNNKSPRHLNGTLYSLYLGHTDELIILISEWEKK